MEHRVAGLICLLLVGMAGGAAAGEAWELQEEIVSANGPRMTVVGRFPSSAACQSRARQLSDASPPDSRNLLGYTCLPSATPHPTTP